MQIPSNLPDPFVKSMSERGEQARRLFLKHVEEMTKKAPIKVMLGDGTVSSQESFNPGNIRQFYDSILRKLDAWSSSGVSTTADSDLRRAFIKFGIMEGTYALSCHMSLQYHALLFYKLDHRVIDIQKELTRISDEIKSIQEDTSSENDKIIEEKMKQKGYENMDQQKLFEVLFERDDITQSLIDDLDSRHQKISELANKRDSLFKDLDGLLIETYSTSPTMIDETRMIAAEEGCLCVFNLEYAKKDTKEGNINPTRIPNDTKEKLLKRMDEVTSALKF